jgi:hypothetical protein
MTWSATVGNPRFQLTPTGMPTSHPISPLNHEMHLAKRRILDVVSVHAKAEIGEVKPMLLHHPDGPNGVVELHPVLVEVVRTAARKIAAG